MPATTTLLGLVTPTQGTLSGTWGDTVNYGISDYVDISVAGTLTLTNDGAVTLANTTGSSAGSNITSSLTGAGTVTAQFAIVRVTGTLTVAKVVTGPSYSKTYTVVNAATGGIVTFKASGQTGVSIAVGESAFVYFNGTDYVKVSGTVAVASFSAGTTGFTPSTATTGAVTLAGTLATTNGGTGLTAFTANQVFYASSTSAFAQSANLTFNGTTLTANTIGAFTLSGTIAGGGNQINNVIIGTTTPLAGAFTTLSASGLITATAGVVVGTGAGTYTAGSLGFSNSNEGFVYRPPVAGLNTAHNFQTFGGTKILGITEAGAVAVTGTLTVSTPIGTASGGTGLGGATPFTANGVVYASSSSALATGSALTFNGTNEFKIIAATGTAYNRTESTQHSTFAQHFAASGNTGVEYKTAYRFVDTDVGELMRLTSTGLGIGTSSPVQKLSVKAGNGNQAVFDNAGERYTQVNWSNSGALKGAIWADNTNSLFEIYGHTGIGLSFYTNALERARIDSSGNVGIATTNATRLLEIGTGAVTKTAIGQSLICLSANAGNVGYVNEIGFGGSATTNVQSAIGNIVTDATAASNGALYFATRSVTTDTAPTERMRLDSAGNLGLGVTPSAWGSGSKGFQVLKGGLWHDNSQYFSLVNNAYYDGTNWKYISTAASSQIVQILGESRFYNAASGTAGDNVTYTQAMTLDASGNLALGKTSAGYRLDLQGAAGENQILAGFFSGTNTSRGLTIGLSTGGTGVNDAFVVYNSTITGGYAGHIWQAGGTERARITSAGYFKASDNGTYQSSTGTYHEFSNSSADNLIKFRNSNASNPFGFPITYSAASPNGTGNQFWDCADTGGLRAEIRSNGGLANYSANNVNLSDRREKTNFAPAGSYLDKICAIPVQTFNYIDQNLETDDGLTLGVVAQDVQAVAPELVMESNWASKDETPKMRLSIYQTDLQYALMKALQELKAEFDAYKASHP